MPVFLLGSDFEGDPQGLKPGIDFNELMYGLKPVPFKVAAILGLTRRRTAEDRKTLGLSEKGLEMTLSPGMMSAIATLAGMAAVFVWRIREGRTAVTVRKILIPPLGMATGFCMFVVPGFRVPLMWAIPAFLIGAIALAWPLLATSRLERDGDAIMMQRSGAFFAVVIVLAAIRFVAHTYLDR